MTSLEQLITGTKSRINLGDIDLVDWHNTTNPCFLCQKPRIIKYIHSDTDSIETLSYCDTHGLIWSATQNCSKKCGNSDYFIAWNNRHLAAHCIKCGTWFKFVSHTRMSINTNRNNKRMHNVPPKQRFRILKRDQYRCQTCGITSQETTLHVDHKTSIKDATTQGWNKQQINADENLWTLCENCNLGKGTTSL